MRKAIATLKSVSPYSQSKHYVVDKTSDQELPAEYEKRTWRERCNTTKDGQIFIPPMAFKLSLAAAARYRSEKVPGRGGGKATYTKHFESGILVMEPLLLPDKKEDVDGEWLFVPSNGRRGGGSRVDKCFPLIHEWEGDVEFVIVDDTITEKVFDATLRDAGMYIGVGRFRPENGGFYGRFSVEEVVWHANVLSQTG